jgi:hypothetical protein
MSEGGKFAGRKRKQKQGPRMMHAKIGSQSRLENTADKTIGLVEWFRPEEYERVERALADCRILGV